VSCFLSDEHAFILLFFVTLQVWKVMGMHRLCIASTVKYVLDKDKGCDRFKPLKGPLETLNRIGDSSSCGYTCYTTPALPMTRPYLTDLASQDFPFLSRVRAFNAYQKEQHAISYNSI
jgi:hypothetical protein